MEILKRNLELVEIKNLQEIYHLTNTLFGKRKEITQILKESNQDSFIKKIAPYIKDECIICTDLINHFEIEETNKVNSLYDFLNEFNDIFGDESTTKLLKKVGFVESHIKETIESLNDVSNFRSHLNIEELTEWNSKNYIQSVQAHKELSVKKVELSEDFFKPLVSYFLNELSKDKKAEFLLKLDLFKKSGWAEYIITQGKNSDNAEIVKLFNLFEETKNSKTTLDYKTQQEFKITFEKFFESIELGININEKGLNIATINNKGTGLYNLATAGMPDGAVKGCPHTGKGETLYVGWATANTKKYAQNLQWFRHLEGIDFSMKMNRKGFESFKNVDGSIVSLAINHDEENIGFINNQIDTEAKKSFQILGETTEICKGLSVQNGRFKNLVEKISSISLIGSKTELSLIGKSDKEIENNLFNIVKNVNKSLSINLEQQTLSEFHKIKRDIYLTDFCNAISYLSEINKQNVEFKEFLRDDISPTFVGLAKVYPEMSNHLMKTLSFALMNADGIMYDVINQIESNANIGFDKDYLQRGFYHFDEKANNLNYEDKVIDGFIKDAFEEIKNPLYDIILKNPNYKKLDKLKENSIWHMLSVENIPTRPVNHYERSIKETVNKFKSKKSANKCIEFFKELQKSFPHYTLLSSVEDLNNSKKERLSTLVNITKLHEKHFGELDSSKASEEIKGKLKLIENMTHDVLKDIQVLERKNEKDIKKEVELFINEMIKDKMMNKDLIEEEIDKFEFNSAIKEVFKEIIKKKKDTSKKSI